ncbi:thermonuclease family protein [Candidatus Dojkabacteria bacterium]|nr:thermonuclease family protein [Candidatus Dojkabacteria bacterium]
MKKKKVLIVLSAGIIIPLLFCCLLFIIIALLVLSENPVQPEKQEISGVNTEKLDEPVREYSYQILSVIDGDTVHLNYSGSDITVRLVGIDSPEKNDPAKPVECYSEEASSELSRLLLGKNVYIEEDSKQGKEDRYGRTLLYLWVKDNNGTEIFVNEYMVREGFARAYTKIDSDYLEEFQTIETEAKSKEKGMWGSACKCKRNEEVSRICIACNQAKVTYRNWDCSTFTGNAQDASCTIGCLVYKISTPKPVETWACDCSKTCSQISSCAEAQYQLNTCGCKARDADHDGIACDEKPLKCQLF